jgi:hypothetical protein
MRWCSCSVSARMWGKLMLGTCCVPASGWQVGTLAVCEW